jgi:hypothetical protein
MPAIVSITKKELTIMQKEYDFSKGKRGKFYHPDAKINLLVYLYPDVADFIKKISRKKGFDIEKIVSDWLRKDIGPIQSVE